MSKRATFGSCAANITPAEVCTNRCVRPLECVVLMKSVVINKGLIKSPEGLFT